MNSTNEYILLLDSKYNYSGYRNKEYQSIIKNIAENENIRYIDAWYKLINSIVDIYTK